MNGWTCAGIPPHVPPCDATGTSEREAEKHAKATQHGTLPAPGCHITLTTPPLPGDPNGRCGEPVKLRGLCSKHLADYVRLGGAL